MTFRHPLEFTPPHLRRYLFFVFTVLTVLGFLIFMYLDQPLRTLAAPSGVVSFELAGTVDNSRAMMDSWDDGARLNNAFGLGFDFLFMPLYATGLSLGILLASNRRRGIWPKIGMVLGWGAYVAIVFDSIENMALFSILQGNIVPPYPQTAALCASIKFGLLIFGLIYGIAGWLYPKKQCSY